MVPDTSSSSTILINAEKNNTQPKENEGEIIEKIDTSEAKAEGRDQIPGLELSAFKEIASTAEITPTFLFPVESKEEKTAAIHQVKILAKRKRGKQSLAFHAGVGIHDSDFSSSNEEELIWRNNLEKPQLGYSLGVRYEYTLRRNFLLSITAGYHLYKDKITTAHIHESPDLNLQTDYKLHNHYHVFSSQVEVGRRFYQKGFFWDINGGIGLKFHQVSEVDYFVSELELAEESRIKSAYQSSGDVFFTARAAMGKYLSNRLFVRTGTQINSGIDLTASQAGTRHRIVPVNVFVELGLRF